MSSKKILGQAIRTRRDALSFSQERLAEKAGITYQYLSSLENGRKNFTIGILERLSIALETNVAELVSSAYDNSSNAADHPKINRDYLRQVPLPKDLKVIHVAEALDETQRLVRLLNTSLVNAGGRALPSYIQANNFSGIVSNILSDSFDRLTPYKHNHDQRYPDLINKDKRGKTIDGLEVKCTVQIGKGAESHNGHSGWHVVACFKVDPKSGDILFIHVMFAVLIGHNKKDSDWKYVGSKVNSVSGSQRTETYITTGIGTTKLRDGSVYCDSEFVKHSRWREQRKGKTPTHSLFFKQK